MTITRDKRLTIDHDFIKGHEYEVLVVARSTPDELGRINTQDLESAPNASVVIRGQAAGPDAVTSLATAGVVEGVKLSWTAPLDADYYATEVYGSNVDNFVTATQLDAVGGAPGQPLTYVDALGVAGLTRYYWVIVVNRSGRESARFPASAEGVSGTSSGIAPGSVSDFSLVPRKFDNNIIYLTGDSWTNDSPGAGSVAWNSHTLTHGGADFTIAASNTSNTFIYWVVGASSYSKSNVHPSAALGPNTFFIIATNTGGVHDLAWNALANAVIGSAWIDNLAVTNAKIANLAVTTGKIDNLAIGTSQIDTLAVTSGKIALLAVDTAQIAFSAITEARIDNLAVTTAKINALAVTTAKIDALAVTDAKIETLGVNKLTSGSISSQVITLVIDPGQGDAFIAAGKIDFTNTSPGFILGVDDSDGDTAKFLIGDSVKFLNYDGTSLIVQGGDIQTAASGKRVHISSADNRIDIIEAAGTNVVIRIDDDFPFVSTNPGIQIASATGALIRLSNDAAVGIPSPTQYALLQDTGLNVTNAINTGNIANIFSERSGNWASGAGAGIVSKYSGSDTDFILFQGAVGANVYFDVLSDGVMHIRNTVQITDAGGGFVAANTGAGWTPLEFGGTDFTFSPDNVPKAKISSIGGFCIRLTNKTGVNTIKGQVIQADTASDDAFILSPADGEEAFGIVLDSGVANNAEAWIVVSGIADVALEDNTAGTHGHWCRTSIIEAGYSDCTLAAPPGGGVANLDKHMKEVGHCLESVLAGGIGTHVLCRCNLHWN